MQTDLERGDYTKLYNDL